VFKHDYAALGELRLHYVTEGGGAPIVFLHGFPEFWYQWRKQLTDFGRDHQAVAPDLRGYNLSSKPPEVRQYRIEALVEDVRGLAEHLGRGKIVLVGHDWGGVLAWAFAMQHPDHLEALVIINAPHPVAFQRELRRNPAQCAASQYMLMLASPRCEALLAADNFAALADTVLKRGLEQGYVTEEDREAYLEAWSQPGALAGALNYYRAALEWLPLGAAGCAAGKVAEFPVVPVHAPTLVIWGENDPYLLPGNLDGLEAFVPRLEVRRIHEASHWVTHEKPELVNSLIREFLAERQPPSA